MEKTKMINPLNLVAELWQNRQLIWKLAANDFKKRYAGSYMGKIWAFVQPVITVLMYWIVFDKVFRFMKENNLAKLGIEYIEVNLSVVQCMQSELANSVLTIMDRYGIEKKMVNLEITETVATNSPKVLLKNMKILSDNGVTFSMDDFGTGYSNISAIAAMPLDIIKLDKSLIDMAYSSQRGKEILMGAVTMVDRMGFKIVAEGIEEKEQFEMLREQGIDYIQGYYFSKPLPEKEFLEYLSK